ncbi:Tyrosine recombinase XerC [Aquicella siphonis]|uniref:Tyrosine recombinase XerC n=1 Tax=Aquicella siphonis TaxID=254247 RepID=A0A5E4PIC8_9COXI|nr:site-specific integrase [Aquicella siphonis]VVC76163.1 Tyrosine recombinase XerC [Aquicella siphonis]
MAQTNVIPQPLFDTLENIHAVPEHLAGYLDSLNIPPAKKELQLCVEFLKSYAQSKDTFSSYRREVERLLHWSWLICRKPLIEITRNDIRDYLQFIHSPPQSWMATKVANRFIDTSDGLRKPNPEWRPFVVKVSKAARRHGKQPRKSQYQLSNKSIEAIFAVLSSMFTYLQQEEYLESNPVSLIRQKKGYIQRQQTRKVTRKLSRLQWIYVINTSEEMARINPAHERTLFLMSAFYLLGLRISELSYAPGRMATMGNFAPDKRGLWWYTTIGKGNKIRDVAVPDELLSALKRYRTYLNLTPLPHRDDPTPLFPKLKGKQGLGARQIRNIVQTVFDRAIEKLVTANKTDEAEDLAAATVHWLRHTAISSEVEYRPREHIRDDVGHENPATMDKYIDTDRVARHRSAQGKPLKPQSTE